MNAFPVKYLPAAEPAAAPGADAHKHAIASGAHFDHEEGAKSAYRYVRSVSTETVEGTLPLNRLDTRRLCQSVPSQDNSRSAARGQARGEYRMRSLVNAVMPAGKVPFKSFPSNLLQRDEGA